MRRRWVSLAFANRFLKKFPFHLYPKIPQKLHMFVQQLHDCEKFLFFAGFRQELIGVFTGNCGFCGEFDSDKFCVFVLFLRFGLWKNFSFIYTPKYPKSCIYLCNDHTIAKIFYFLCSISGCQQQANRKTAQIFCIFIDSFFSIIFIRLKQKEIHDMIKK